MMRDVNASRPRRMIANPDWPACCAASAATSRPTVVDSWAWKAVDAVRG